MILRAVCRSVGVMILALLAVACGGAASRTAGAEAAEVHRVEIPTPPAMMTGDSDRIHYVATRYWDNFDFADTTWIADTMAMERAFVEWAEVLMLLSESQAAALTGQWIRRAEETPSMQLRVAEIAEYYLSDPNSAYRNEQLLIPVLEAVLASPTIDTLYKMRPRVLLAAAMKNRPGTKAADLTYLTESGEEGHLYDILAAYTLLMFYNPGCQDCGRVEEFIVWSPVFASLIESGRMKVLAVYPDKDLEVWREHLPQMPKGWIVSHADIGYGEDTPYDLPAIPCLYLLDENKTVLFKDAPVEQIEWYLSRQNAESR